MDADESIKTRGDRRKKGWPTKKTREEFQKNTANIGPVVILT
jgi:hypothetical protein